MNNSGKLAGRTLFITGASRGIGKAIALKAAKDGANIVIAAKTVDPHPKLPGTIYTAAKEIEAAGGRALACVVDVRDENQVRAAVEEAVRKFGGIDIVINNASAISLTGTADTEMKRYDLMQNINARGTFLVSKECLPYLKKSSHAHILNISPPLSMAPHWFSNHVAYTIAKYGMSLCVLGMHEEFKHFGIGVNALWPKTTIYTAAVEMLSGSEAADFSRKPEIMADAAYAILTQDPRNASGNFYIDEYILKESGVEDLDQYACNFLHKDNLVPDLFVDNNPREIPAEAPHYTKKGNKSTGKPKGKVADAFQLIESKLNKEMLTDIEGVYKFILKGEEAGEWFMELINGSISYGCGSSSSKPDSTLTMDSDVFISMFSGKVKPTVAYMTGKLRIEGNVKQGLRLEKLTNELKSKL